MKRTFKHPQKPTEQPKFYFFVTAAKFYLVQDQATYEKLLSYLGITKPDTDNKEKSFPSLLREKIRTFVCFNACNISLPEKLISLLSEIETSGMTNIIELVTGEFSSTSNIDKYNQTIRSLNLYADFTGQSQPSTSSTATQGTPLKPKMITLEAIRNLTAQTQPLKQAEIPSEEAASSASSISSIAASSQVIAQTAIPSSEPLAIAISTQPAADSTTTPKIEDQQQSVAEESILTAPSIPPPPPPTSNLEEKIDTITEPSPSPQNFKNEVGEENEEKTEITDSTSKDKDENETDQEEDGGTFGIDEDRDKDKTKPAATIVTDEAPTTASSSTKTTTATPAAPSDTKPVASPTEFSSIFLEDLKRFITNKEKQPHLLRTFHFQYELKTAYIIYCMYCPIEKDQFRAHCHRKISNYINSLSASSFWLLLKHIIKITNFLSAEKYHPQQWEQFVPSELRPTLIEFLGNYYLPPKIYDLSVSILNYINDHYRAVPFEKHDRLTLQSVVAQQQSAALQHSEYIKEAIKIITRYINSRLGQGETSRGVHMEDKLLAARLLCNFLKTQLIKFCMKNGIKETSIERYQQEIDESRSCLASYVKKICERTKAEKDHKNTPSNFKTILTAALTQRGILFDSNLSKALQQTAQIFSSGSTIEVNPKYLIEQVYLTFLHTFHLETTEENPINLDILSAEKSSPPTTAPGSSNAFSSCGAPSPSAYSSLMFPVPGSGSGSGSATTNLEKSDNDLTPQ